MLLGKWSWLDGSTFLLFCLPLEESGGSVLISENSVKFWIISLCVLYSLVLENLQFVTIECWE